MSTARKVLPSLSSSGWVDVEEHPLVTANALFSHFFCSDYSQTQLYLGEVSSFAYVIQEGNGDITKSKQLLSTQLDGYFKNYFENVEVEVGEYPDDFTGQAQLTLYLQFSTKNGTTHTLSKAINFANGTVQNIMDINNGE